MVVVRNLRALWGGYSCLLRAKCLSYQLQNRLDASLAVNRVFQNSVVHGEHSGNDGLIRQEGAACDRQGHHALALVLGSEARNNRKSRDGRALGDKY